MAKTIYRLHKRIECPEITGWLRLVERGSIKASHEMHQLCKMVRHIFATERLFIDKERLERYMGYQQYFPFELGAEEKFLVALWLCTFREGFFPRFDDLLLYVGRGFGKTGFAGYLAFCLISPANGIQDYDVDICATVESQAKIGYDDLWRMFERRPDFWGQAFTWNKVEMYNLETGARFKYWSGNSESKDGMRSGAVFFDEVHAYQTSDAMEVFTGGLGKKEHPRRLFTTTDGDVRDGVLDEKKAEARAILDGKAPDGGLLPFICKLDSIDEIDDESCWVKANPRLMTSKILLEQYRKDAREWRRNPQKHPMTPTKRFNLPQERKDIAVTSWANLLAASTPIDISSLSGMPCVIGIDYAKTTDMVGAVALFKLGDKYQVLPHAWWCTQSSDAGEIKAPLNEWAALGQLDIVDDVEVSPESVAAWVSAISAAYDVRMVSIDSYRISLLKKALKAAGFDGSLKGERQQVWLTRPSDIMRVQPVIDSAFATHSIAWGDSPLMRWATNNAKLVPAPNDNFTYGKIEPHSRKTDPFMALVHAFVVADKLPEQSEVVAVDFEPMFF